MQGALEKHILKHSEDSAFEYPTSKKMKQETSEETLNHIKLEPEVNVNEENGGETAGGEGGGDDDFLDRLLDDLEYPAQPKKRKRRKKKPPTKDFSCSDCGKDFYFQKNLFTHVVEKHGKSADELPNLALVKSEEGVVR